MNDPSQNEVYKLVHRGGGPTFVANQLRVSSSTIHGWMRQGRIPSAQRRLQLIQLVRQIEGALK